MTDLYPRSLPEEPPSAASTASGGSFSSTHGALGEALLSHSAASEDNNASPSAAVTPHPPAALHPLCPNCLTEVDEDFYCSGCSKQLPLICAAGLSGARNAQGEGEAPQATLPGLTRTPRTPQPGRTT